MGARHGRRFFLATVNLVGVGLIAMAYVLHSRQSERKPAPEPAWRSADRSAVVLEHQLRPLAASDSLAARRVSASLQTLRFFDSRTDAVRVRMTRSLDSGHEFEAEIGLICRPVAAGQDLELTLRRERQTPVRLRLEVRSGALADILQAVGTPVAWQPWTGAQDLPLALGDLPMGEVLALCRAFAGGECKGLGYLAGMGSRPQLVLELSLVTAEAAPRHSLEPNDNPASGARALAYVDSVTCDLRSVRVFDAKGYVVRVYEDLVWEMLDSGSWLSGFQVTSMPSRSHTVFQRVAVERSQE